MRIIPKEIPKEKENPTEKKKKKENPSTCIGQCPSFPSSRSQAMAEKQDIVSNKSCLGRETGCPSCSISLTNQVPVHVP